MAPRQPVGDLAPVPRKRNPITGYRVPDVNKQGEIVCDVAKKKWKLGKAIGVGAFGDIYLASDEISKPVGSDTKYVVKMEPHTSGPLFVEKNFYLRAATERLINEWKTSRRVKRLGMPKIHGFGSFVSRGEKLRFIVLPKYGESIYKVFQKHSQRFHLKTALTLAGYIVDVLEYIHSQGYIHSDIKALNMVLGEDAPVYLIDFGLVCRYQYQDGTHKDYTPDGRKADVGTLEFSGRDAHIGVVSRRSDLESLGYNLVTWLGGKLPWEDYIYSSDRVSEMKEEALANIRSFLNNAFSSKLSVMDTLEEYFHYISQLEFNSQPDYTYCKNVFCHGIRNAGFQDDLKLTFDSHAKLAKKALKRPVGTENWAVKKKNKALVIGNRKPCSLHNYNSICPRVTRAVDKNRRKKARFDWASILAGHPERDLKKKEIHTPSRIITPTRVSSSSDLSNPTSAMIRVLQRRKQKTSDIGRRSRSDSCSTLNGVSLTPAMEDVIAKRKLAREEHEPSPPSKRVLRSASRRHK